MVDASAVGVELVFAEETTAATHDSIHGEAADSDKSSDFTTCDPVQFGPTSWSPTAELVAKLSQFEYDAAELRRWVESNFHAALPETNLHAALPPGPVAPVTKRELQLLAALDASRLQSGKEPSPTVSLTPHLFPRHEELSYGSSMGSKVCDDVIEGTVRRSKARKSTATSLFRKTERSPSFADMEAQRKQSALAAAEAAQQNAQIQKSSMSVVPDAEEGPSLQQMALVLVQFQAFEGTMIFIIMASAASMGMEIEQEAASSTVSPVFAMLEYVFTVIFFAELCLRTFAFGPRENFLGKEWFFAWLDLLVVSMALLEICISLFAASVGSDSAMSLSRLLRLMRITRVVRVVRVSKLIRFVTPLRALLFSILVTGQHLAWSLALLLMIIYVFSMLFTRLMIYSLQDGHLDPIVQVEGQRYWGSLFSSMMTLFKSVTGGTSWEDCTLMLHDVSPIVEVVFAAYIAIAVFAVLNVMTGTFCQSAIAAAERNPNLIAANLVSKREKQEKQLQQLFSMIDNDGSGEVTCQELEVVLSDTTIRAGFEALGLAIDDAWTLFKLIDKDGSDLIDIQEFIIGCRQLSGEATTLDLAKLAYEVQWLVDKVSILVARDSATHGKASNGTKSSRISRCIAASVQ